MILHCPFCVASCITNRRLAERGVAHTQHSELRWQAVQVQADAVKVGVGGAAG